MKLSEKIKANIHGHLTLFNDYTNEVLLDCDNKVVDNGAIIYTLGLSQYINKVGFGSLAYGVAAETESGMDELQSNDTHFVNATVKLISGNSITFEFRLGKNEFNNKTIREYGLFYEDSSKTEGQDGHRTLFSRVARTGSQDDFLKTSDISVRGEWTITLTGIGAVPVYR